MSAVVWALLLAYPLLLAWLSSDGALARMSRGRRRMAIIALIVAGAVILIGAPHFLTFSGRDLLVFTTINVLVVASYRLMTLTGEWSLVHYVMVGCGGYASALLTKEMGFPVLLGMLSGGIVAAAIAFVLSFPLFRMKAFYFLIGSFAAGEAIRLTWKRFRIPFGGPKGIKGVPGFPDINLGFLKIQFWQPTPYYYLALVFVVIGLWLLWRIERSRIGLTLHAVHWQDQLADAVGVNTWRVRTLSFLIASFFAGISGTLMVHYLGTINPDQFDVEGMVSVLIWVIVGGTATMWGSVVGLVLLTIVNEVILRALHVNEMRPLFYGVILILAMLFLPDGIETLPTRVIGWLRRERRVAEPAE